MWAATSEGVWSHSTKRLSGAWKLEFAPNPAYLPGGSLANDDSAAYKNIANDIAIDPKDPSKVVLAVGWRSGDDYNGFYTKVNGVWTRITSGLGDLPADPDDVGNVTFARSADGSRYYAIDQSPSSSTPTRTALWRASTSPSPVHRPAPGRRSPTTRAWPRTVRRSPPAATCRAYRPGTTSS